MEKIFTFLGNSNNTSSLSGSLFNFSKFNKGSLFSTFWKLFGK